MKAKKQILIAALLIVVSVSGLFGVYVYHKHRHFYHTVWSYGKAIYRGDIWQRYQGSDVHVSDVYAKHLAAGRAYGWPPIEFDISYKRFNGVISYNASLQKVLEKILINKRSNHKILFIFERTSSCYHITVPPIKNS